MSSTLFYRIAAGLLLLFAAGHTMGFLRFVPATAEGAAVREAMMHVQFPIGRANFTYQSFYVGFGLLVTAYLVFAAVLAWQLGMYVNVAPELVRAIGWGLVAVQAACMLLSWRYFFPAPIVFSLLVVVCLLVATFRIPTAAH